MIVQQCFFIAVKQRKNTLILENLENSGIFIDGVRKTVKHEIEKQNGVFLCMLLPTSGGPMLENVFNGKGVMRAGKRYNDIDHMDKGLYPLSNIKITKYFNYEPRFNGVFSRDNLFRRKDGAYVINLDDKQYNIKHRVSLFIYKNKVVYFYPFSIEYIFSQKY